ncbi:hypothetical protein [Arthrobacter sp. JSM 101049]|uniref:hypothetical protein n=1 Tax=Arthrobacter sp. JSM 101049 TaxID=929097 RepID=UPI0035638900
MFEQLPLMGEGRSVYPKPEYGGKETARVLITVKAAPQPSASYGDTVCVAGIRLTESGPEWIRLYPVPFRSMEKYEQFKKYELLDIDIEPAWKDSRSESFKPDTSSIRRVDFLKPWSPRHPYVAPLAAAQWTMCGILKARERGELFPSLAVIEPKEVKRFEIYPFAGWTDIQQTHLKKGLNQPDLFGNLPEQILLDPPRFEAKFHYTCEHPTCGGHRQGLLDWEMVALSRNLAADNNETAMAKIKMKFLDQMCKPELRPHFFVGNQQKRPHIFSVLGIYPAKSRH